MNQTKPIVAAPTYSGPDRRTEPSNSDIYRELGTLTELCRGIQAKQDITNGRVTKNTDRITAVERRQSWFMGGIAAIVSFVAFVGTVLGIVKG